MTDGDAVALMITAACTGVATLITSIGGLIVIIRTKSKVEAVAEVADATHATTNSLAVRSERAAHDVGYSKGKADALAAVVAKQGSDALAREQGAPTPASTLPVSPPVSAIVSDTKT